MANVRPGKTLLRFGVYELDLRTEELRKAGILVKLPPQPFKILALLAQRCGQLVSREEIREQVWGSETFVDFEHGLNVCIKRIRDALNDDAAVPRYVETLPRRGYRFLVPVELPGDPSELPPAGSVRVPPERSSDLKVPTTPPSAPVSLSRIERDVGDSAATITSGPGRARAYLFAGTAAGLVAIGALLFALNLAGLRNRLNGRTLPPRIESVAVLPLDNLSHDPQQEYFADGMTEELITILAQVGGLKVISRTSVMPENLCRRLPAS